MTDHTSSARPDGANRGEHGDDPPAGLPRWAKIAALVALLLALVVAVVLLVGSGEHSPSRHTSSGMCGTDAEPTTTMDDLLLRSQL